MVSESTERVTIIKTRSALLLRGGESSFARDASFETGQRKEARMGVSEHLQAALGKLNAE